MRASDFDFALPERLIALRPAEPRGSARLLRVTPGAAPPLADAMVEDLPEFLRPGDCLVLNDTRVLPVQLEGVRARRSADGDGARIALTLHKRMSGGAWRAFAKPAKRLRPGDVIDIGGAAIVIREKLDNGEVTAAAECEGGLDALIRREGVMPLPPYIAARRRADDRDHADYQTAFARHDGAVAAPTAALHFTPALLERTTAHGAACHFVTLHVGAGTFLPVKTDDVGAHEMHPEWGEITPAVAGALNAARAAGGRIIACGTTVLRLLETAASTSGRIEPFRGETSIFITPGHRFRAADMLMTNFHLPRSTLFMLVSAFSGTALMKEAYAHAVASGYRFYSYGDSSLLQRAPGS